MAKRAQVAAVVAVLILLALVLLALRGEEGGGDSGGDAAPKGVGHVNVGAPNGAPTPPVTTAAVDPPASTTLAAQGGKWVEEDGMLKWKHGFAAPGLEKVRRCLKGKHVVFVGDSVMRYQYMSLLHWLHFGSWPNSTVSEASNQFLSESFGSADPLEKYARPPAGGGRSIVWQKEWPTWEAYLRGSTAEFNGAMCCDCHRAPQPHVNRRKTMAARTMHAMRKRHWLSQRENRFYSSTDGSFRGDFFFLHGDYMGNGMTPGHVRGCPLMMGGNVSDPPSWPPQGWAERWRGTTPSILGAMREAGYTADFVVFNTGLWYPNWVKAPGAAEAAVAAAEAMMQGGSKRGGGRAVWQTVTNQCQRVREADREAPILDAIKNRPQWRIVDAGGITEELVRAIGMPMDKMPRGHAAAMDVKKFGGVLRGKCGRAFVDTNGHFQPFVYRELVLLLLSGLGC
eukprot:Hpha_TRINITY_DN9814_c0_g1::TRINITY_DN9814_c0_g1_i4::g.81476::m.81476